MGGDFISYRRKWKKDLVLAGFLVSTSKSLREGSSVFFCEAVVWKRLIISTIQMNFFQPFKFKNLWLVIMNCVRLFICFVHYFFAEKMSVAFCGQFDFFFFLQNT